MASPGRPALRLTVAAALCTGGVGVYAQCSPPTLVSADLCHSSRSSSFDAGTRLGKAPAEVDAAQWSLFNGTDRLYLGTVAGPGGARPDASANGSANGNMGIYGTWYQDDRTRNGWYADVRGQFAWDDRATPLSLGGVNDRSRVGMASAEVGYAVPLGEATGWTVQPQGQLIYLRNNNYNLMDTDFASIDPSKRAGWTSRMGIRVQPSWVQGSGWRLRPYAAMNWWHDDLGDEMPVNALSTRDLLYPSNRYELKAGVNVDFKQGLGAWGDLGRQWSNQSYQAWTVRAGMKYAW